MRKLSHLTRTSLLLFSMFALDKVIAFVRQIIITRQFRLSAAFDAFNAANNLPDLLFALISGGALAMAFIPVLSDMLTRQDRTAAWDLFSRIANLAFLTTAVFALVVAIFADRIVRSELGIVPGFEASQQTLVVELMRLNLIATLIFSISGLVIAGLQANQHFFLPALAPILYNFGQIFGAVFLSPSEPYVIAGVELPAFGLGVHGLVYGVILGAALHLGIQVPGLLRYRFRWTPRVEFKSPEVVRVLTLLLPRILTMFFIQTIFLARDNLASRLAIEGAISTLTIGWMIMQVPETTIGTAIGTAFLPSLSEYAALGDWKTFRASIEKAVRILIALTVPVAAVMSVGIGPLIALAFSLSPQENEILTWTTRVYLLGLTGHSVLEVAVRAFYARQDAIRPLIASFLNTSAFIGMGILAISALRAWGAPSIALIELAFTGEAILLLVWLNRRLPEPVTTGTAPLRALLAAAAGGVVTYAVMAVFPGHAAVGALIGMGAGGLAALPFIMNEIRILINI